MVATLPLRPSSSGRLWRQANASIRWVRVNTRSVMRQLFAFCRERFSAPSRLALILLGDFVNSVCNYIPSRARGTSPQRPFGRRSVRGLLAFYLSHPCSS